MANIAEVITVKELDRFEVGDTVTLDAKVRTATLKTASNNSQFLDLVLGDNEKEVSCKIWGVSKQTSTFIMDNEFVRVEAKVNEYKNTKQLIINRCFAIPEDELDVSKLKKTAPESVDSMVSYIEDTINNMEDVVIKTIVLRRWQNNKENFVKWVAARSNHHNYETGLLYHTFSMLRTGKHNVNQYPNKLDADIVYGGIILHDMDKIREYTISPTVEFTDLGTLYGHVFMSASETYCIAKELYREHPELDFSKVPYLIHAILSHHGKLEWGSPVVPKTIEAELIHQIDMMDSRMNMNYDK